MIELIHPRLPELTSETELMCPHIVGNDVRQVAGDVITAFGGRETDLLKSRSADPSRRGYYDVGRPENGLSVDSCIRTEEQAHGLGVKAVVEVVEDLVEVVDAYEHLIGQARCENGVQHHRVVVYVEWGDFKIIVQIRAGCSQRRAATERCNLVALSPEPTARETVLL